MATATQPKLMMVGYLAEPSHRRALEKLRKKLDGDGQAGMDSIHKLLVYAALMLALDNGIVLPPPRPPNGGKRPGAGRPKKKME